jgi:GntR family transcriptional repressor for pyruvate dehydrogenase complex
MKPILKAIKRIKISEEIVQQIQDLIKSSKLLPGDFLPSEREMTHMLGVSRPPLREALKKLEAQGFIEIDSRGKNRVRSITDVIVPDTLAEAMAEDVNFVIQLLDLRKLIESWAASKASVSATKEEIEELEKAYKAMEEDFQGDGLGVDSDARFHMILYKCTHNSILSHLMANLFDLLWRSQKLAREIILREKQNKEKLLAQHLDILEAVRNRDPEKAEDAALAQLDFVETQLVNFHSDRLTK